MEQTTGVDSQDGGVQTAHPQEFGRAPTPPWEKSRYVRLYELPDGVPLLPAFKTHESGEFEDHINNDGGDAGFETRTRHSGNPVSNHDDDEEYMTAETNDGVDVQTMAGVSDVWPEGREDMPLIYTVEEPVTEGRLTEVRGSYYTLHLQVVNLTYQEGSSRGSVDVESVATRQSATPDGLRDAVSTIGEPDIPVPPAEQKQEISSSIRVSPFKELHTVPGQPRIPMPVTADANVPDPTESPTRRREGNHVGSLPIFAFVPDNASKKLAALPSGIPYPAPPSLASDPFTGLSPDFLIPYPRIQTDGLFTPAEPSTTTTPAESATDLSHDEAKKDINARPTGGQLKDLPIEPGNSVDFDDAYLFAEIHQNLSSLDDPSSADVFVDVSSAKDIEPTPLSPPAALSQWLPSVSLHVPLSRSTDPILMADPYPYSLSTPEAPQIPDDGGSSEDNTMDNSISFDSITEKGTDDQVVKDENILAELELPQRSQSDFSTQLRCTAHPDEADVNVVKEMAGEIQAFAADAGSHPAEESETAEPDAKDLTPTNKILAVDLIQDDATRSANGGLTHSVNLEE